MQVHHTHLSSHQPDLLNLKNLYYIDVLHVDLPFPRALTCMHLYLKMHLVFENKCMYLYSNIKNKFLPIH